MFTFPLMGHVMDSSGQHKAPRVADGKENGPCRGLIVPDARSGPDLAKWFRN